MSSRRLFGGTVPSLPSPPGTIGWPSPSSRWAISPLRVAGSWQSSVVSHGPSRTCCLRAVSDLNAGSVALTFFLFLVLFTLMLAVEINILLKQIKKGPDRE